MATLNWPGFGLASISPTLDQPSQSNSSAWTGKRTVVANPWHGKWSFQVTLATRQGDAAFQAARAFFTSLKGQINTFHLPAVEAAQNANTGVTLSANAAQGATSLALTGVTTALVAGNMVTIAGQLLSLTTVGSLSAGAQTVNFQPALRAAASSGASVETAKPYALVYLGDSSFTWDIGSWRRYGLTFNAAEAVSETDGASPSADVWNGSFSGVSGLGTAPDVVMALAAPTGAEMVGTTNGGTVQSVLSAFKAPATDAVAFIPGLKIGDPSLFGYPPTNIAQVYRDAGLTTTDQHTLRVVTAAKGDNTNYRPQYNAFFEYRDRSDVVAGTKNAGYALSISVSLLQTRNNVPIDDVAGLTIGNTGGVPAAKATDAIYISENPGYTAAGTSEWYSIFSADCKSDVCFQIRYTPSTGKVARFPNNCGVYFRNAADTQDVKALAVASDNAVTLGDAAQCPRIDLLSPINCTQNFLVSAGVFGYNTGTGGSQTQITSKSTGVILNKSSGEVVMNNAALAAATQVAFTLTNSLIGANDKLDVWIKSGFAGAGTYSARSEGNASGSRAIIVKNESGGSLSEAVVVGFNIIKGTVT